MEVADLLQDNSGRRIEYLRVSLTDRCNLGCIYCMPPGGISLREKKDLLTFEDIHRIVRAGVRAGISSVRLTGGEPLLRKDLPVLVSMLGQIRDVELSMTTNGILLSDFAQRLGRAGLNRVNISIDTLDPDGYAYITRGGRLKNALAGVDAALDNYLDPVKINVVLIKGLNDSEINRFVSLTFERELNVRFIELMPTFPVIKKYRVSCSEVKEKIRETFGSLEKTVEVKGKGPSENYRVSGAKGTVGFIEPHKPGFCRSCNRLRLTSTGELCTCLYHGRSVNLKSILKHGSERDLTQAFEWAARNKAERESSDTNLSPRNMYEIGG